FDDSSPLAAGAVCVLEDDGRQTCCWLLPAGAGERFPLSGGRELRVVTPRSPLGQSLLGLVQGDVCGLDTAEGSREYEVVEVA
ncbi:MAG TPA: GreA/GreB family elongation factor, partial [Polyangiaceae bacterium]|nr:GreA/GreB family elongation factor [Polyangiaceae bacterium]